ncbi:hypothetical protein NIES4075_04990 [Tolypothrix sp. NIES-4075]|nr:hypothetical protein NIES4075_04990 [Tolypothrix sp. NIES-4075]
MSVKLSMVDLPEVFENDNARVLLICGDAARTNTLACGNATHGERERFMKEY